MSTHTRLTESSLSPHPRKGREGNKEEEGCEPIHKRYGTARGAAAPVDNEPTAVPGSMDGEEDVPLFDGFEPIAAAPEPTRPTKWTERQMLDLLAARYTADQGNGPRYVFAEHVRNEAGFGGYDVGQMLRTGKRTTLRTADAIAVDLWPSTGNLIHGFEVKVSRSDWLTELRDPEKANAFRPYVDHWWLVVSDTAIVRDDLPDGWGLLAIGRDGKLRARRRAPRLERLPLTPSMTASLLRAAVKTAARRDR